jgi:hypothetical protein
MNKDKRVAVKVLADITKAYADARDNPTMRVLMVIRDAVKDLAASEERSMKRMEPFKDAPGTSTNYQASVTCWSDLLAAQQALEQGELSEAHEFLEAVATPPETEKKAAVR